MDDELQRKLAAWVEISGRALELRTARTFRSSPAVQFARQSVMYEDGPTKQQREGDVVAVYRWLAGDLAVSLEVAVECKAGREHPWVAFYDDVERHRPHPDYWFISGANMDGPAATELAQAWQEQTALSTRRIATHAVSAFGKDGKNFVHDAARQAMSFARARAASAGRYVDDPKDSRPAVAVAPVVVTQAPLFDCELTPDGEVILQAVDRFDLMLPTGRWDQRRVYVRSEAAVVDMADAFSAIREKLSP